MIKFLIFFLVSVTLFSDELDSLKILTTTPIYKDWIRMVGKDKVIVYSLIGPKNDPYSMSLPEDLGHLVSKYDFFYDASKQSIRDDLNEFVTSYNPTIQPIRVFHNPKQSPYTSFQVYPPLFAIEYLEGITVFLQSEQPQFVNLFQLALNSSGYRLEFLNRKIESGFKRHQGKTIVTDVPFFNWFASFYNLNLIHIDSSQTINDIIEQVSSEHVQVVLVDRLSDHKLMNQIKKKLNCQLVETDVFSQNYTHMVESLALGLSTAFIKYDAFNKRRK